MELARFIRLTNDNIWNVLYKDEYNPRNFNFLMRSLDYYRYIENDPYRRDEFDGTVTIGNMKTKQLGFYLLSCWSICDDKNYNPDDLHNKFIGKNESGMVLYSTEDKIKKMLTSLPVLHNCPISTCLAKKLHIEGDKVIYSNQVKKLRNSPIIYKQEKFKNEVEYRFWIELNWYFHSVAFGVNLATFLTGYWISQNVPYCPNLIRYFSEKNIRRYNDLK